MTDGIDKEVGFSVDAGVADAVENWSKFVGVAVLSIDDGCRICGWV